jgi:hypothetical protein
MIYPLISTAASLDLMLNSAFVNVSEYTVYAYFIHDNNFVSIPRPIVQKNRWWWLDTHLRPDHRVAGMCSRRFRAVLPQPLAG